MGLLLLLNGSVQGKPGSFPVRLVEIAFNSNPLGTPIWTDVTSDVRLVDTNQGRSHELSRFNPGRCTVVLDNRDRAYDPLFTGSPHNGKVRPGKKIRVSATWNHMHRLFTGYVDSWLPGYSLDGDAVVTVSASDATKLLARTRLAGSVWEQTIRDDGRAIHWWRLSEPGTTNTAVDVAGGAHGTYVNITRGRQSSSVPVHEPDYACLFDGVDDHVLLPAAGGLTGTTWTFEAWVSAPLFDGTTPRTVYSQGTSGGTDGTVYVGVRGADLATSPGRVQVNVNTTAGIVGIIDVLGLERTHIVVTRSGTTVLLYVNGALETSTTIASNASSDPVVDPRIGTFSPGTAGARIFLGAIDDVILWDVALTLAEVTLHYEAGTTPLDGQLTGERVNQILDWVDWPAADRDIDTGRTTCQSADLGGNAWDYLNTIAETENGAVFVDGEGRVVFQDRTHYLKQSASRFTFGDGGGTEIGFSDFEPNFGEEQVTNEARISRLGGVVRTAANSTSVTDFGPHGLSREGLLHDSDQESQDHADYTVAVYGEPEYRIDKIVAPLQRNSTAGFPVLGLSLQDRVTVTFNPPGGGAEISQVSLVEGISHAVTPKTWRTEFWLSAARAEPDFLILNSTVQGHLNTDRLGY